MLNVNVTPGKMKGLFIVICCLLCLGARGQGIVFDEGTFEEALAKAKKEGKMVFVDCYTSWCGPCKRMAQQVFPMAEVGEAMNGRFVCLMRDMEKGEGVELAKRYRVSSWGRRGRRPSWPGWRRRWTRRRRWDHWRNSTRRGNGTRRC